MTRRRWVLGVVLAYAGIHVAFTTVAFGLVVFVLAGGELPLWGVVAHAGVAR
jgi:hypothetical protein